MMRSTLTNPTLPSNSSCKPSGRTLSSSNKPPIPPKPVIPSHYRPLSNPIQEMNNVSNEGLVTANFFPTPQYPTYPTAVLINDGDIPYVSGNNDLDCKQTLETLTPLTSLSCNGTNVSLSNLSQATLQGVLPPLTKVEISPKYLPQVNHPQAFEFKSNMRPGGRTLSATAKNALLMEKIGGSVNKFNNCSKEILPRTNSNPETSSSLSVTVNKSCIISVNNYNNSFINNNNNNNHGEDKTDTSNSGRSSCQRKSLNFDNPKFPVCSEVTINSVPLTTALSSTKTEIVKNTNASNISTVCPACYQQSDCHCRELGNNRKSISPVNKRKSMEDTLRMQGTAISINGICQLEETLVFQDNKSSTSIQDNISPSYSLTESCDKHLGALSSASPSCTLSHSAPCSPATKPILQKSEAFDVEEYDYYKRLSRGISRATDNVNIVSKARSEIAQGIWEALESGHCINNSPCFVETPVFTFTLPDLSVYSDEFRSFLEKDLIEMSTLISLEAAGRLNWWAIIGASQRLWPLATSGDGNCLLHAASLGMWGFHDRLLALRKALHEFLTRSKFSEILYRRWRWQLTIQNKETGLVLSHDEWEAEWESILRLASSAPRGSSQPLENTTSSAPNLSQTANSLSQGKLNSEISGPVYESLEEIHVLALAHVLRRPIIVVADITLKDMNGDPLAPIPFGGIYLPLECPPQECQRSPLVLTYDAAHFSALVVMETNEKEDTSKSPLPAVIPVSDCGHDLLPLQFLVDPGDEFVWGRDEVDEFVIQKLTLSIQERKELLNHYLDLVQVPIPSSYLEATPPSGGQEDFPFYLGEPLVDLDKKSSESSFDSDDGPPFSDGGGPTYSRGARAPRQLQTVVKSFGSLGRSMSKRIRKNLNNLSKFSRSGSFRRKGSFSAKGGFACPKGGKGIHVGTQQNFILGARIHTDKRQAYQQMMIENYLAAARGRFMRDAPMVTKDSTIAGLGAPPSPFLGDAKGTQCINPGCSLYGTVQTSYLCSSCFSRQREREERAYGLQSSASDPLPGEDTTDHLSSMGSSRSGGSGLQYGAGRSRFYAALDENSMRNATLLPVSAALSEQRDRTLFLSNSTFYNDSTLNTSSIASYNLNRDLNKRSRPPPSSPKRSSNPSISSTSRSSSSLSDPLQTNRFGQDRNSRITSTKDPLAPICIDGAKVDLQKGVFVSSKTIGHLRPAKEFLNHPTTVSEDTNYPPKPCLTKGCEFYGNPATDYLCSKCHLSKKNPSNQGTSLDLVKYVHI